MTISATPAKWDYPFGNTDFHTALLGLISGGRIPLVARGNEVAVIDPLRLYKLELSAGIRVDKRDHADEELMAAKMVGRWRSGCPSE